MEINHHIAKMSATIVKKILGCKQGDKKKKPNIFKYQKIESLKQ